MIASPLASVVSCPATMQSTERPRSSAPLRVFMLTLALSIGASIGCAWHVAPIVFADELSERIHRAALRRGMQLQIGDVYVDLTSRVVLDDVVVHDRERRNRPPVLRAARIEVQYQLHGVMEPRVHVQSITVHAPRAHLHRGADGSTNVDSILALRASGQGRASDGAVAGPGLRKFLSRHIPQLVIRDLAVAIDDDKGRPLITPAGIDARHLRLTGANLVVKNTASTNEIARFDVKAKTRITGFKEPLQVEAQVNWPERNGWVRVELPGDFAIRAAGFEAAVQRVTAHSDGRVLLGGVSVERLPADNSPFSLDIRQVAVELSEKRAPLSSIPRPLRDKLPAPALALLRHIGEIVVESPVIVGKRPAQRAALQRAVNKTSMLLPRKTSRTDRAGKTTGKKTRDLNKMAHERRRRTAKQRAMGKEQLAALDGKKVRDALVSVATASTDKLAAKLKSLRKAAAMIPVRKLRVRNGRARYRDERLQGSVAGEMSDFSAEVGRTEDGIVSARLRFGVPGGREGTENAISGRVHAHTGDCQVSARLDRLPLMPYAAVMPAALTLHKDSAIEKTAVMLRFDAKARTISIDGKGAVNGVDVDLPPISRDRIENLAFGAEGKLHLDLKANKLAIDAGRVDIDRVQVLFDGSITNFRQAPVFDMAARIPTVHCQDAVDSVVDRFAPVLSGMRCSGSMAFRLAFALKTKNMRSLKFEFEPTLRNLKIDSLGKFIDFAALEAPFEHNARQPDGTLYTFVTGPGSERWVPLEEMAENLVKVVTTTEDGLFFFHKGFSLRQIRGAMVANLRKGRFVRGASTISQQVAKNLFFVEREKTISRKMQEAVVTWEMEHRLTKQQILELYFNIIEFGPRIYGIKAAANHYFNRAPGNLTLLQSIWLGSIIPGPRRFYHQFVRGNAGKTWREYLCWIARTMRKREKIDAAQLARLGACEVVFGGAPDGSEAPEEGADFGLGHDGDPTLQGVVEPTMAGGDSREGAAGLSRVRAMKRKQVAPSVSEDEQP